MESIEKFLGEFTPQIVQAGNDVYYAFPDMLWLFKAILLLIIALYTVKGIYSILRLL